MVELVGIIGAILTVLAAIGVSGYTFLVSSRMLEAAKKDYVELLSQTIDNLKAQTLQERVEAKAIEKETDVRIEMLKDAMKASSEAEQEPEPQFVTTTDGREIDLRDYDIV
jgi:uncharacterized membrane protein YccC